jgi:hypothetical protein
MSHLMEPAASRVMVEPHQRSTHTIAVRVAARCSLHARLSRKAAAKTQAAVAVTAAEGAAGAEGVQPHRRRTG